MVVAVSVFSVMILTVVGRWLCGVVVAIVTVVYAVVAAVVRVMTGKVSYYVSDM